MARSLTSLLAVFALASCTATGTGVKPDAAVAPVDPTAVAASEPAPADARALLEIERTAASAYAAGRNAEAADLYLSLTRAAPAEATYWYRLANTLVRTSRYDDAAIAYRQALVREPANARAWHNLGIVRMRQAQEAFAEGVKRSAKGEAVQQDSLRLSTSLYSLTTHGAVDATASPSLAPDETTPRAPAEPVVPAAPPAAPRPASPATTR